ncbi:HNH endonuclease [Rhizobium leguminosarum]|uniref:HNH endonuclease n=1 Tax=Rhizobium leguminosarum TaxID=384 RepID=UPI001031DEEA|nr:HNH endonuclease signature motif containing protein [Rhizobium leguminosarum]TBF82600.1 HNH endonuclease [Rhizobium leguminosarum]TBH02085.1 HNH endonuclease [Rhizobium leguminosarum]TBH36543.1 HNH endonuclease [Rhizobium leguminosarum]TBH41745.1 HNH endonuclease [Rhizobium leguminosarum]TBH62300.1 HNH endonuclease [Rhizobium leguminosarum]
MTTYLLKINCELHLGGANPRPTQSSAWENIRVTFPNPSRISGGPGQPVKNGDQLVVWAHEDPGFGSGLGLTAEGNASEVAVDGGLTSATLTNVALLTPHYKLRGWSGGSSGSVAIDHLLSHRHLRSYELEDTELREFRSVIAEFIAAKKKQLATMAYMSDEEMALLADSSAVLNGFERRFTRQEARPDQAKFRAGLMQLYKGRCVISRCSIPEILDAAHIVPFSESVTFRNDTRNGLVLRTDLHALFDKLLLSIHPQSGIVILSPTLQTSSYRQFEGRKVVHFAANEFLRAQYLIFKAALNAEIDDDIALSG